MVVHLNLLTKSRHFNRLESVYKECLISVVNPCVLVQCECFSCWKRKCEIKGWKRVKTWQPLFLFTHCRSWEESSTWMPSHSVCPRLHHEPEQAWKGVLQYRCGRLDVYGFKALPEPQTHRIRSTGNSLVSQRGEKNISGSTYPLNQPFLEFSTACHAFHRWMVFA